MKTLSQNLISLALGAIIFWLLQDKGCNKPKEPVKPVAVIEQKKIDSVTKVLRAKEDSSKKIIERISRERDSALRLARSYGDQLRKSQRRAAELAANIDLAVDRKDTTAYITNCNELADQVRQKDEALENNQAYYEAVIGSYNQIVDEKNKQLQAKDSLLAILRNSFSIVSSENISLAGKVNKLQKRSGRKYGLSPAIGYGYVTGSNKPQGFVGVALTRDFIKFKL